MENYKSELIENLLKSAIPTISMFRVEYGGHRLYSTSIPCRLYCGLTGALDAITFKGNEDSKRLQSWRLDFVNNFGKTNQEGYVGMTADFGTLVHRAMLKIWQKKKLIWGEEQKEARAYFIQSAKSNSQIPNERVIEQQILEYCKAAAALMYFVNKEVVEIYAIEAMCKTDEHRIATPIDLVCKLKNGKKAAINIKTSSQLNDKHREQSIMEKFMWNETYPDNKVDVCGLLRTKDWNLKKEPTYEFEVVDEEDTLENLLAKFDLSRKSEKDCYIKFPREKVEFSGETILGQAPKLKTMPFEQFLDAMQAQKETIFEESTV